MSDKLWKATTTIFVAAWACLLVGCKTFDMSRPIPWKMANDDQEVAEVVVFWTNAIIERAGAPPLRGFGGRVYFYPADSERSIEVTGTLVVYAFDDSQQKTGTPPVPLRKYVFTPEQLKSTLSESKLGPSYNLLIPWDDMFGDSHKLSLICRYIPPQGPSVVSEQARVFLPGTLKQKDEEKGVADKDSGTSPVRQVGYEAPFDDEDKPVVDIVSRPHDSTENSAVAPQSTSKKRKRGIETLTIPLTHTLSRQLEVDPEEYARRLAERSDQRLRQTASENTEAPRVTPVDRSQPSQSAQQQNGVESSFDNSLGRFWETNAIERPAPASRAIANLPPPQVSRFAPPGSPAPIRPTVPPANGRDR
ncbi:hypothetical protein JCM19992_24390 [Thermostilla marina]